MIWHNFKNGGYHFTISDHRYCRVFSGGFNTSTHEHTQNGFDKCYRDIPTHWECVGPTVLHRWIE